MISAHSPLAPSSAYRWEPCPGSVPLEARYPEQEETEASAEGTASHHAGAEELLGRPVAVGDLAPNGVVLTDEMIEGASMWTTDVFTVCIATGTPLDHLQVEQRVQMPRIFEGKVKCSACEGRGTDLLGHPCDPCGGTGEVDGSCYGTPDTWLYVPSAGTLYVWDYKFGHGVVEHVENWQLIAYVCGILDLLGIDGRNDQELWVDMRVVQPRAYHRDGRVRSWRVRASDLRGYFNKLAAAAAEAMGTHPHTLSGPHCLHCKAAAHCPTLKRATWSAADFVGGSAPESLDADSAAYELGLLEHIAVLVKARLQGREADVTARLKRGEVVADWCLEPTYGRQTWKEGDEAQVIAVGDMCGVNLRKPEAAVTPLQAVKLAAKKGVDASVIYEYSETPRTGVKLARDTNLLNRARAGFGVKLEQ